MNKLTCRCCGKDKPANHFRERKPGQRDLSRCKECRRDYQRAYRGVGIGNGPAVKRRPFVTYEG